MPPRYGPLRSAGDGVNLFYLAVMKRMVRESTKIIIASTEREFNQEVLVTFGRDGVVIRNREQ